MRRVLLELSALLIGLVCLVWLAEGWIDSATRLICPAGWWHTSAFWAHCAYPPVSIAKYGLLYSGYAVLGLLAVRLAAPAWRQRASGALLIAMMAAPACFLLVVKFSWVETAKLILVAVIALLYSGARVMQRSRRRTKENQLGRTS